MRTGGQRQGPKRGAAGGFVGGALQTVFAGEVAADQVFLGRTQRGVVNQDLGDLALPASSGVSAIVAEPAGLDVPGGDHRDDREIGRVHRRGPVDHNTVQLGAAVLDVSVSVRAMEHLAIGVTVEVIAAIVSQQELLVVVRVGISQHPEHGADRVDVVELEPVGAGGRKQDGRIVIQSGLAGDIRGAAAGPRQVVRSGVCLIDPGVDLCAVRNTDAVGVPMGQQPGGDGHGGLAATAVDYQVSRGGDVKVRCVLDARRARTRHEIGDVGDVHRVAVQCQPAGGRYAGAGVNRARQGHGSSGGDLGGDVCGRGA